MAHYSWNHLVTQIQGRKYEALIATHQPVWTFCRLHQIVSVRLMGYAKIPCYFDTKMSSFGSPTVPLL